MTAESRRTPPKRRSAETQSTRVVAVFHHRAFAERVAEELERADLPGLEISIEDRRLTDDPPEEPAAPAIEENERRRDAEVAGHVFKSTVLLSIAYAVALATVAALIGGAVFGWGARGFWILLAVGAVTGSVLGGVQGGIGAAMTEAEKEEGTLLVVEAPDPNVATRAEEVIRRHQPARVDVESGGRLAG
ncbi:MAG: hypothetical protein LC722_04150 [Actinobacteria bacterium]|nr:hypothetical protein [Actinomycetota bacterium]